MMRQCNKCKLIKDINEYRYRKEKKYYEFICKSCNNLMSKKRYIENKGKYRVAQKKYYQRPEIKEKVKQYSEEYSKRPDVQARRKINITRFRNRSNYHQYRVEYLNRPEVKERNKILARERAKKYRKSNPHIKLKNNISKAIHRSIKKGETAGHWEKLVGYTLKELMQHFEKLFTERMTWNKFLKGEIHLDHIVPISRFNFEKSTDIDFKRCWALSNLQPLWAHENHIKSDKIKEPFQPCLALGIGI